MLKFRVKHIISVMLCKYVFSFLTVARPAGAFRSRTICLFYANLQTCDDTDASKLYEKWFGSNSCIYFEIVGT